MSRPTAKSNYDLIIDIRRKLGLEKPRNVWQWLKKHKTKILILIVLVRLFPDLFNLIVVNIVAAVAKADLKALSQIIETM